MLFSKARDDHHLLFCAHHIIADFSSMAIMLNELKKLYAVYASGREESFDPLKTNYLDYVSWQNAYLKSQQNEHAWQYWQQQLKGEIPKLELPTDRVRSRNPSHSGRIETLTIDLQTAQNLKALALRSGTTLFMVLLSVFKVLLYRYSGQQDIIIGSPVAGRLKSEFANLVGYFVNPVSLRSHPSGNKTFTEYLSEIRQIVLGALEYQNYPFTLLVEKYKLVREEGMWPFYQVMFVLQGSAASGSDAAALALGMPGLEIDWPGMKVESASLEETISPFDLLLMLAETNTGLLASFQYDARAF